MKRRSSKSNLDDNWSGNDDLIDETENQENLSSSTENSEEKVSLASQETNQNKTSCKLKHRKHRKQVTNEKKRNSEEKSYEKDIENEELKISDSSPCAPFIEPWIFELTQKWTHEGKLFLHVLKIVIQLYIF